MSLANALVLAVVSGAAGAVIAFVVTVWLAERSSAGLRRENALLVDLNADLRDGTTRLTAQLTRAGLDRMDVERRIEHTLAERDVFVHDNARMHRTLRRQIQQIKELKGAGS